MPHINRIRVNNVKYNFGTQFYDDFIMRFDGKNALYDLANGGGKSVLLLLLMQNMIPNCSLDDKQPVEKLFRGPDGSTVIHSLIEWHLDDYLIEDGFRYMLTGFCARKAKNSEEGEDGSGAAIEYFNYVIFYRSYNENDIVNLPLVTDGERVTYPGLKNYLKGLAKSPYQIKVHVFERKGEYQQFISRFGLYESEWEIIRGINRTEGHVRAYFENNYKTTRKVVEDLLIEEIIQKAFMMQTEAADGENPSGTARMAENLYLIRDQLTQLMQKRRELDLYDGQQEALGLLKSRTLQLNRYFEALEEFNGAFSTLYRSAANKSRKRGMSLSIARKEQENAGAKTQDILRRIETVRLQADHERLRLMRAKTKTMENTCMSLKGEIKTLTDDLRLRESMNDYQEHALVTRQRLAVLETLRFAQKDQEALVGEVARYALEWERRCNARIKTLSDDAEKARENIAGLQEKLQALEDTERDTDKKIAVSSHQMDELKAALKNGQRTFDRLREDSGLLLAEQVHARIREISARAAEAEKEKDAAAAMLDEYGRQLTEHAALENEIRLKMALLNQEMENHKAFLEAHQDDRERIERLQDFYKAEDLESLKEIITARYHRLTGENIQLLKERTSLGRQLAALEDGLLAVPDEAVSALLEDLRSKCQVVCVFGADYLQSLDPEAAAALIRRLPFLPEAVIVKEGLERTLAVTEDDEAPYGSRRIPVIGLSAVTSDKEIFDASLLHFTGRAAMAPEEVLKQRGRMQQSRENVGSRLTRIADEMRTYAQDLEDLTVYMRVYAQERQCRASALEEARADHDAAAARLAALEKTDEEIRRQCQDQAAKSEALTGQIDDCRKQLALYQQMKEESLKLDQMDTDLQTMKENHENLLRVRLETINKESTLKAELEDQSRQLQACEQTIRQLTEDFEANWRLYASKKQEAGEKGVEEILDDEHLLAALQGAKAACEQAVGDQSDKQLLMETYEKTARRLQKAIESRGFTMDQLAGLEKENRMIATDDTALAALKRQIADRENALQEARDDLEKNQARMYELSGSVSQAQRSAQAKFGELKAVDLKSQDPEEYIRQMSAVLDQTKAQAKAADEKADRLTRECWQLENMQKDLERMVQVYGVSLDEKTDIYDIQTDLKRLADELPKQADKLRRMQLVGREDFERDRMKAAKDLDDLGAEGLAQALRGEVSFPEDAAGAEDLIANIDETIHLIALEKEHAQSGVSQLLEIKKHFEDQCLQICLNIRTELDKLPKMSVISMDNEKIQMVGLRIPYINENLYAQRMSDYIENIVKAADKLPGKEEQMTLIRRQLSWKRLFSVIVTDMNAIRMTLYKRERVREQSRYLKYEEAVGSTGQSQGIYIQFLIAVIHYISSIHAGAVRGQLRKTIFIDNPFGAARDIYIWEPIFKLLSTNHVQLIVPVRGTTPAVTGKFDVNYVLDQKLTGGKLQTIVADFSSNVVVEDLSYEKIEYEQLSFLDQPSFVDDKPE